VVVVQDAVAARQSGPIRHRACLQAVFALSGLRPSARRRWLRSAVVVGALAYAFGVLTGLGVVPSFR